MPPSLSLTPSTGLPPSLPSFPPYLFLHSLSLPPHLRNLGYCPTIYMMLEAMMALLSFPLFCSHSPSNSLITVTRNRFSSSSCIAPLIDPIAQQSWEEGEKGGYHVEVFISTFSPIQNASLSPAALRFFSPFPSCTRDNYSVPSNYQYSLRFSPNHPTPPIHTVLRFFHDHSVPSTCRYSFSVMMCSVSL